MVTMTGIDRMMADAQKTQPLEDMEQIQTQEGDTFSITGIQLNRASQMVTIYQRETGEPRTMPRLAAEIAMRKRYRNRQDPLFGQFIFSSKPTKTYYSGTVKCQLHPDNPNRAQYDTWGLPTCEAAHLASPGAARRHMELRHPSANKLLKEEALELQRKQELEASTALAESVREAMASLAQAPVRAEGAIVGTPERPLYVSDKPKTVRRRGPNRK